MLPTHDHEQIKSNLMFSQYEIAIIKSIWLSLDLCSNFTDRNVCTKNSIPMFKYNDINLEKFEVELCLNIFTKDIDSPVKPSTSSIMNHDYTYGLLERYSLLLSKQNFQIVKTNYQVNAIINLVTIMIYHLEYGKSIPQSYIMKILKINSRLYSINSRNYSIFGNSLIKTIAYFSSNFYGDKRQIFSKFISKLLTTLVYYSNDSNIINFNTINPQSNPLHDNYYFDQIHQTLTNCSTISNTSPTRRSTTTMSILSQPSESTEESSLLSLMANDNTSELSSSDELMILSSKPFPNNQSITEEDEDEEDENEEDEEKETRIKVVIDDQAEEEATITQSYDDYGIPDDSYDYLNSFGLSEIDTSPINEPDIKTTSDEDLDDLRSLESAKSNLSSFKSWSKGKFHKYKRDHNKKFVNKNLVRSNTTGSLASKTSNSANTTTSITSSSNRRHSFVGEDEGCIII